MSLGPAPRFAPIAAKRISGFSVDLSCPDRATAGHAPLRPVAVGPPVLTLAAWRPLLRRRHGLVRFMIEFPVCNPAVLAILAFGMEGPIYSQLIPGGLPDIS